MSRLFASGVTLGVLVGLSCVAAPVLAQSGPPVSDTVGVSSDSEATSSDSEATSSISDATREAGRARARALFAEGSNAIAESRWADAVEAFREVDALTASPVALFNLAFAYRALGRYREARDAFDEVIASAATDAETRADAARLRAEVAPRLAMLELRGLPSSDAEVSLDAFRVDDSGTRPLAVEADPGPHALIVRQPGHTPFEWRGELRAAERTVVDVVLAVQEVRVERVVVEDRAEGASVFEDPILWAVVGAVLVGSGLGVGLWAVDDAAQLRPEHTRLSL